MGQLVDILDVQLLPLARRLLSVTTLAFLRFARPLLSSYNVVLSHPYVLLG
ncbi:MAG: hypothetical protein ACP5HK_03320 [Acidilobus sp.]